MSEIGGSYQGGQYGGSSGGPDLPYNTQRRGVRRVVNGGLRVGGRAFGTTLVYGGQGLQEVGQRLQNISGRQTGGGFSNRPGFGSRPSFGRNSSSFNSGLGGNARGVGVMPDAEDGLGNASFE